MPDDSVLDDAEARARALLANVLTRCDPQITGPYNRATMLARALREAGLLRG